jgi:catechol 2,3-dioxygenase-like lactoylglutathione lyase family enzyme
MLDHVSITVSDIVAAERFYDAIMKALGVVKVGRRDDWLGYGERARSAYPDRIYLSIRQGPKPEEAFGRHWCLKARLKIVARGADKEDQAAANGPCTAPINDRAGLLLRLYPLVWEGERSATRRSRSQINGPMIPPRLSGTIRRTSA